MSSKLKLTHFRRRRLMIIIWQQVYEKDLPFVGPERCSAILVSQNSR